MPPQARTPSRMNRSQWRAAAPEPAKSSWLDRLWGGKPSDAKAETPAPADKPSPAAAETAVPAPSPAPVPPKRNDASPATSKPRDSNNGKPQNSVAAPSHRQNRKRLCHLLNAPPRRVAVLRAGVLDRRASRPLNLKQRHCGLFNSGRRTVSRLATFPCHCVHGKRAAASESIAARRSAV